MTKTTFLFKGKTIEMEVPSIHDSYASNILRENVAYFCHRCGEIFARRFNSSPLHPYWQIEFKPCQACRQGERGLSGVFFNNYQLNPKEEKSGIQPIHVLPKEILAIELKARPDGDKPLDCYKA